jgi:hypothetical protein
MERSTRVSGCAPLRDDRQYVSVVAWHAGSGKTSLLTVLGLRGGAMAGRVTGNLNIKATDAHGRTTRPHPRAAKSLVGASSAGPACRRVSSGIVSGANMKQAV